MICKNCAEMAQKILGDSAVVSLATNLASVGVKSNQEAKELTEALQDVGLDATLLSVSNFLDAASSKVSKNEVTKVDTSPTIPPNSKKRRARRTAVSSLMATDDTCGIYDCNGSNPVAFASQEDPLLISPIISSKPTTRQVEVMIGGMTCTMCSRAITQTLQKLSGIDNVQVNLATGFGSMTVIEGSPSTPQVIIDTIESIGYTAREVSHSDSSPPSVQEWQETQQADARHKQRSFLFSLIGTVPISFLTMILPNFNKDLLHITVMINGHTFLFESIILAGLGTIVQFGSGWSFYKNSHNNILSGQLGMDVLVAVGTTASYCYAWIQTWNGEEAHAFETSAVLISFVLLGKWLNSLAVRRTSEALTHLLQLQSKTAILVSPDGAEKIVDVDQIQPGSFVRILRGASLPADGVVYSGELTVDESMMTGETMPILKSPGSLVLGGTVCQESDGALIKVTGVGSETALSQIVKLVQEAQTKQVPIQDLADSISSIFVPTVCTLAILTFLIWYALCNTGVVPQEWYEDEGDAKFSLMFGIACLVISCPCALGLATPTAVMVSCLIYISFCGSHNCYHR
jgi:P-type Cu+ transporter